MVISFWCSFGGGRVAPGFGVVGAGSMVRSDGGVFGKKVLLVSVSLSLFRDLPLLRRNVERGSMLESGSFGVGRQGMFSPEKNGSN